MFLHADSEDSDQTESSLGTQIFLSGFVMLQLNGIILVI